MNNSCNFGRQNGAGFEQAVVTASGDQPGTGLRRLVSIGAALGLVAAAAAQAGESQSNDISTAAHPGWVLVPGELIRPDCVHEIPNGARVEDNGDITVAGVVVAHYDPCPEKPIKTHASTGPQPKFVDVVPGTGNGWVEDVQDVLPLSSGDNISKISSYWKVPTNPGENGATVFLWNGIEPTSGGVVLQPVLQWGPAGGGTSEGAFGGNYWVIASWLAHDTASNSYHSPGVRVSAGDTIYGETYITSTSSGKLNWEVKAKDVTSGAWSDLGAWSTGDQWVRAYAGVLEAYDVSSCSQFPLSDVELFYDNDVYHDYPSNKAITPSWSAFTFDFGGPACGYLQIIDSMGNYLYW